MSGTRVLPVTCGRDCDICNDRRAQANESPFERALRLLAENVRNELFGACDTDALLEQLAADCRAVTAEHEAALDDDGGPF